jgi:hypothetical protein
LSSNPIIMGQQHSKEVPVKRCEADLKWVLQESAKWSERAPAAKLLLDGGACSFRGSAQQQEEQVSAALAEVDALLKPKASTAGAGGDASSSALSAPDQMDSATNSSAGSGSNSSSSSGSGSYGSGSNGDIFDVEQAVALPLSHPAHQFLASQLFGAAATKDLVLAHAAHPPGSNATNATTGLTAGQLAQQSAVPPHLQQLPMAPLDDEMTEWTRGRLDRVQNTPAANFTYNFDSLPGESNASSRNSSAGNSPRHSLSSSSSEEKDAMNSNLIVASTGALATNPHEPLALAGANPLATQGRVGPNAGYEAPTLYDTVPHDNAKDARGHNATATAFPQGTGLAGLPNSAAMAQLTATSQANLDQQRHDSMVVAGTEPASLAAASKERIELVSKYLFVSTLLDKMTASAQTSFQLALQAESLRKRLKPKRTKDLSAEAIRHMRASKDAQEILLKDNMNLFFKSRLTLQWFYTDFNLCYSLHRLHDAEVIARNQRDILAGQAQASDATNLLSRFDQDLVGIENRRVQLELHLQANERTALSIAHYYLSRHSAGEGIAITDVPDLAAGYFAVLDSAHTQRVNREQLQAGLCRLAETVDSLNARIRALQMHNESLALGAGGAGTANTPKGGQGANMLSSNTLKISKLQAELQPTRQALRDINNFFLATFVRNVFVNLSPEELPGASVNVTSQASDLHVLSACSTELDAGGLLSDLAALQTQKQQVLNPLDVASQGRVGPDEVPLRSALGTGLPLEHAATSVDQTPARVSMTASGELPPQQQQFGAQTQRRLSTDLSLLNRTLDKPLPTLPSTTGNASGHIEAHHGIVEAQPSNSVLAGVVQAKDLVEASQHLDHLAANGALAPIISAAALDDQAHHLAHVSVAPKWSEPAILMATPTIDDSSSSSSLPLRSNEALAEVVQEKDLKSGKKHLGHVVAGPVTEFGGVHKADANIAVMRSGLLAHAGELNHVAIDKAATTSTGGIHLIAKDLNNLPVVPSQAYTESEAPCNGSLALLGLEAKDLSKQKRRLSEVKDTVPSSYGGVHDAHATDLPIDAVTLAYVRDHELTHVPIEKAPHTASGGVHLLLAKDQQPGAHVVPEQVSAEDPSNMALAGVVSSKDLQHEKRHLSSVAPGGQPSQYGGVHPAGASLGGARTDPLAMMYVKDHSLAHVAIDKAPRTASGGVHMLSSRDQMDAIAGHKNQVPEQAFSASQPDASSNAALAGVVRSADLKSEKRGLDHVALDLHASTLSGGVHTQGDLAGTPLKLSILDKVKAAFGLDNPKDHIAPAEGLGRVVESPFTNPNQVALVAPISSSSSSISASPIPRPSSPSPAPVSAHAMLAPVVRAGDLVQEGQRLHHVDVARVEMRRDIAAGVGSVTTRPATGSRPGSRRSSLQGTEAVLERLTKDQAEFHKQLSAEDALTKELWGSGANETQVKTLEQNTNIRAMEQPPQERMMQ